MDRLMTPEHLHAAVNHLPLIGLIATAIPILYGLIRRQAEVLTVGFIMCVLFGGSMALVIKTGDDAEHRLEQLSQASWFDAESRQLLEIHESRGERAAIPTYAVAAIGIVGLALQRLGPSLTSYVGWIALAAIAVAVGAMMWAADSGGQIRHSEFRSVERAPIKGGH